MVNYLKNIGIERPSNYQLDIFNSFKKQLELYQNYKNPHSFFINAAAGAGKTSTIIACANILRNLNLTYSCLFLAFNKSIADELKKKLPDNVDCFTFNSLGNSIYSRYAKTVYGSCELDKYKVLKIINKELNFKEQNLYTEQIEFLVSMSKSYGVVPDNIKNTKNIYNINIKDFFDYIVSHHGVYLSEKDFVYSKAIDVLTESIKQEKKIDFDDQKYMSVIKTSGVNSIPSLKYDIVMIDEVQDINYVDLNLIKISVKDSGMVIGVGDKNQSIYGFRGSNINAVDIFKEAFNAKEFPLSLTYRCAKNIVKHARELVDNIEALDNAPNGEMKVLKSVHIKDFNIKDMIICHNNSPLIGLALKCLKNDIPVIVKGRDIGKGLITIIENLYKKNGKFDIFNYTVDNLKYRLDNWYNEQMTFFKSSSIYDEENIYKLNDTYNSIKIFIENNTDNKIQSLTIKINELFSDDKEDNKLYFSTVHKAKGLEADTVYMLDYRQTFYKEWVKKNNWNNTQEINLDYVARTRARLNYYYIDSKEILGG